MSRLECKGVDGVVLVAGKLIRICPDWNVKSHLSTTVSLMWLLEYVQIGM